ncbi:phosphatase PAP2 family protein [Corynebacterium sp. P7202]|uniref:Phosphatase PAP2 family protein n=2 Tax=Corynebacterium pygosceleis TaxID=2800406 RepID=A0A9Q4GIG6_9CORY|nr:phosphatase PAP2 family protein [Corynebacterium pygosceleis]MCK7637279.1 phosphatase PAP2 family protein [Corynebacterium pygosceleis]MCX7445182.1 phosphatase PAP2 family protein [Corynebacterium pygosceleis]MCX7468393.1 phosphatase PAP2 family protein [Corynebacterium pygosceleis]
MVPDVAFGEWLVAHRAPWMVAVSEVLAEVFRPWHVLVFATVLAVLFLRRFGRATAVRFWCAVVLAQVVTHLLKPVVGRSRPPVEWRLVVEPTAAFPSGHVTGAAALAGAMVVVFWPVLRGAGRWAAVFVAAAVTVSVAASRLILGVHWLSDTVAGVAVAVVSLGVVGGVGTIRLRRGSPSGS